MVFEKTREAFARRVKEYKTLTLQRKAAETQIKKKAQAAFYRAREKEEIRFAEEKAKIQTDSALKKLKERQSRPPLDFFQGMGSATGFGTDFFAGFSPAPTQKKEGTQMKKKRKRSSGKRKRRR